MDNYNRVIYSSPYDAKVEYLASPASASTYIDTGLKQSDIVSIETQFADISGYGATYRYSIGSGTGSNDSNILGFKNYNGNLTVNLKGSTTTVSSGHLNTFKTVSVNFVTGAVKIDSAERELTPCELTDDILYLFKIPTVSGQRYGFQPIMLKYFKAFSANNALIRDMIPVRVGQIGYMYDRVSKQLFANQGTGNFVLGSDVYEPNFPKVRYVMYQKPYFSEVEYLEFPENYRSYIITPIHSQQDLIITCKFKLGRTDNGQKIFGCLSNYNDGQMVYNSLSYFGVMNNVWHSYMYTNVSSGISPDTEVHTVIFDVEHGNTYLDGTLIKHINIGTIQTSVYYYTLGLVVNNQAGSLAGYCKNLRIYSWSVSKHGTTLIDMIPVRIGQIGYMYDKVSGQLFGNSGTGNFILGPDLRASERCVMPMPYDSKIEYLESTGTQYIDLDYRCSANTIASVTVLPTQSKTQQRFIGSSSAYFEIYHNGSGYYSFASHDNIHTSTTTFVSSTKVNLTTKRNLTINNVTPIGIVDSTITNIYKNAKFGQLYLLTRPSYHHERAAVCKLYAASVTDGDFKMDLIPVRKNGIGYMYDRVSGKLFGNAGTGNFILGNDIND